MTGAGAANLRFRALGPDDLDAVHRLHGDPAANRFTPMNASPSVERSGALLEAWLAHAAERGFGYELAFDGDDLVGIAGARVDGWQGREVLNLYWRLLREHQGRGLAAPLADHALGMARGARLGIPIVARMMPDHAASVRVAERLGLVRDPSLDGRAHDVDWIVWVDPGLPPDPSAS